MVMQGRSTNWPIYRYGFNGKERYDEVKDQFDQYDYGTRI
jgi:hypothetical protein